MTNSGLATTKTGMYDDKFRNASFKNDRFRGIQEIQSFSRQKVRFNSKKEVFLLNTTKTGLNYHF